MSVESFPSFEPLSAAVEGADQLLLLLVAQQVRLQVVALVEPGTNVAKVLWS